MEIKACPTDCDCPGQQLESNDVVIDVPQVMAMGPAMWPECCIYRVPKTLRKVNVESYTPKFVSIGPFHHGKQELKDMEKNKLRYLRDFLRRAGKSPGDLVKSAEKIIKDNERKIRHCYSEDCSLDSKNFVNMILLDAIFIIELFLKEKEEEEKAKTKEEEEEEVKAKRKEEEKAKRKKEEEKAKRKEEEEEKDCNKESDYILSLPWLQIGILHDLILLENQLPFFILEELYMLAFSDSSVTPFVELSRKYFRRYEHKEPKPIDEEVKHFTDLLRYLFRPKEHMDEWGSEEPSNRSIAKRGLDTRFCATKLDDAGLKFKAIKDNSRSLLEISSAPGCVRRVSCYDALRRFSCFKVFQPFYFIACLPGMICFPCLFRIQLILEVPQLVIDDDTETIFRNLMALEQCHYPSETYICSYVLLWDRLVDTEKDVDLLVYQEVIVNQLGSNAEVASLTNKLCSQIVATTSSYNRIARRINEHYDLPLNHMLATLKREYFPNIFRGTATVVGLIVLGFTLWNFLRPFVL